MISIVVPFYNEEDTVEPFFMALAPVLAATGEQFEVVCVNDGSRDGTLDRLRAMKGAWPTVRIIDLSRNFGKEAAMTAGLDHARGEAVVLLDADLQDPPLVIGQMVQTWRLGAEVVLAHRADRSHDPLLRRWAAYLFYRVHNWVADYPIPRDVGDFRLMDRKVVDAVNLLRERQRFMKGLFSWVGFRVAEVEYERPSRAEGVSKFPWRRLFGLAWEAIVSGSMVPLRFWLVLGSAVAAVAGVAAAFLTVGGGASPVVLWLDGLLFIGGVQLLAVGILGEYLGRVLTEAKERPIYIVRDEI